MLDPGKRKCHLCFEERDTWGIPIPNCSDPDGTKEPCQYPVLSESLMEGNIQAVTLWQKWNQHLIHIEASFGGAIYTLNLAFLNEILRAEGISPTLPQIAKLAAIFQEWRMIQTSSESPKTKESMKRLEGIRKGNK